LSVKVTPEGRLPVSLIAAVGLADVFTVKLPALPTSNVVPDPDVIVGASGPLLTVSVKVCEASVPTPLVAVIVSGYVPSVPSAAEPESVAVPFPLSTNETPVGSGPLSEMADVGYPVVVTLKLSELPVENVLASVEVIAGA
jgi:hypothetical protein